MGISNWISENVVWITLGISIIVLVYFILKIIQQFRNKQQLISQINVILIIVGLLFLIFLTFNAEEVRAADWGQLILMIGLVTITANYAYSTEKMANELKEQRLGEDRPYLLIRLEGDVIQWDKTKEGKSRP